MGVKSALAQKYSSIRNRWRAKASLVPIGEFQGLLLGVMLTSKHDELEPISFNMIKKHSSDVFEFVSSQGNGMQKHSKCDSDGVTNLPYSGKAIWLVSTFLPVCASSSRGS